MSDAEVYMFPIRNEQGFKVQNEADYAHMISTIINAQLELSDEYPDKTVLVVFEIEDGIAG